MKRSIVTMLVALATSLTLAAPAGATHAWGNYHWGGDADPRALSIVDNMTPDWDVYREVAHADWDASAVIALTDVTGDDSNGARKRCKTQNGVLVVCNAAYGFNGWLGVAQIWVDPSNGHIAKALAKVNDSYFDLSTYDDPSAKLHVTCQEVGHVLGLGHQHDEASCMDDANGLFDPAFAHPGTHDYEQLEQIYAHLDDPPALSGGNGKGRGNGNGNGNGHGNTTVSVGRDGAQTVVTFTIWA